METTPNFRDPKRVAALVREIATLGAARPLALMEVCGSHTMAIRRFGIHRLLPPNVRLLSGPGCPVCVTPRAYIDAAVELSRRDAVVLATFGDMLRVPGSAVSLEEARTDGAHIETVYSCMQALELAAKWPKKRIVFLAVGFETTAPTIAATVLEAHRSDLRNFFVLAGNKRVPPALRALLASGEARLDGLLLPGHVCAVAGVEEYAFLARDYGVACACAGFEPLDLLLAIRSLLKQIADDAPTLDNQYPRAIRARGNEKAKAVLTEVFTVCDSRWRGLGTIPQSGLRLRPEFARFDIESEGPLVADSIRDDPACRCGEILKGLVSPPQCPQFGKRCHPLKPLGPCMVSSEGACAAYYKYGGENG